MELISFGIQKKEVKKTQNRLNMRTAPGSGNRHTAATPTILFAPVIRSRAELQTVLHTRLGVGELRV